MMRFLLQILLPGVLSCVVIAGCDDRSTVQSQPHSGAAAKTHKPKSEGFFEGVKRFFDDLTK